MDTIQLLLEREILIKKLDYAKQKLLEVSAELNFGDKTKGQVAFDAYKAIDVLNNKEEVW